MRVTLEGPHNRFKEILMSSLDDGTLPPTYDCRSLLHSDVMTLVDNAELNTPTTVPNGKAVLLVRGPEREISYLSIDHDKNIYIFQLSSNTKGWKLGSMVFRITSDLRIGLVPLDDGIALSDSDTYAATKTALIIYSIIQNLSKGKKSALSIQSRGDDFVVKYKQVNRSIQKEFRTAIKAARAENANHQVEIEAGYVYLITNPVWPGWVKVGSSLDLSERLSNYQTGDPFARYHIERQEFVTDRRACEHAIMRLLGKHGRGVSNEWFEVSLDRAIETMTIVVGQFSKKL